ncbi:MAG TPA: HAMP domain-containing sensor histidine kinase [Solirubrobacteraceae bacterium]|nr:HAMP domain-containing sensor histidine kinase [Solirubrobacteraceae bacterium]
MPRPLRSLRNRLTLIFALIVTGAIGIVYFYVTPRLEDELVSQKVERLAADAQRESGPLEDVVGTETRQTELESFTSRAANLSNSEVSVLQVKFGRITQLLPVADSSPGAAALGDVQGLAERAARTRKLVTGTAQTDVGRQALAAQPLVRNKKVRGVAVFAGSLSDVQGNVELIRNRILVAGAIALVLAALGGYLVARALTERIKRLERAARKVAAGDFSNPIHADSDDELGQLAATFDDMQRQLARLDTARKQFIASASHELRTPIFSLGGFLELLEDEELDDETRAQFLSQLRGQVARLQKLATELLDLSRLESGSLELRTEPTDVGRLARDVADEFTPAVAAHNSELHVHASPEPIEIECDPERVAQVMRILLDNALVHTPAGTSIVVSAARADGHVTLEVADEGLGIRHQTMPHIFEPFYTSADGARGAGLGLAIARELAERMHGELSVRSVPGETAFKLTLPA